jgi:YVTN family beta-propeller protein
MSARLGILFAILFANIHLAAAAEPTPLEVEAKIPLGDVQGRIDHLAADLARQRLYVAELGNDSVGVVDLKERRMIRTVAGLREPQGIGYVSSTDTVYVANAGDGSVRLFRGAELTPAGQIELGSDADNVRVDEEAHRVFVGYGDGALAIIDVTTRAKVADIALKGHPESFRLENSGQRIFINIPDAHSIVVVDRASAKQIATWPTGDLRANYPLALDESGHVLSVFRHPARVAVFQSQDGRHVSSFQTCGDSDDVFVDSKRHRVYVICGEGVVETFEQQADQLRRIGRLSTVGGARTGLFVPDSDRLYIAVRATLAVPASIWVLRPMS